MLQAQRLARRGLPWRMPERSPTLLTGRGLRLPVRDGVFVLALAVGGLAWIVIAQAVESHYLRLGVLVHLVVLVPVAAGLSITARLRCARVAEAAGVAHDLRGPLVTLQATLELLAGDGFGAAPARDAQTRIQSWSRANCTAPTPASTPRP